MDAMSGKGFDTMCFGSYGLARHRVTGCHGQFRNDGLDQKRADGKPYEQASPTGLSALPSLEIFASAQTHGINAVYPSLC
jgi:hypothetical protein